MTQCDSFDIVVVGGGHAGCEAALAAARMGCTTLLLTINLEKIALMPCNPAIGGVGKGQLTREIDALGGEQGRNTDRSFIQMKMLNTSKGPAVRSLRAQADKKLYEDNMKLALAAEPNLKILEGVAAAIDVSRETITGIRLADGSYIAARSVVSGLRHFPAGQYSRWRTALSRRPHGRAAGSGSLQQSRSQFTGSWAAFSPPPHPVIDARSIDPIKDDA